MSNSNWPLFEAGRSATVSFTVEDAKLANVVGSGDAHVLATPMLIAGMEAAACQALAGALPEDLTSVGAHIDVYHTAPTPVGAVVQCSARLERVAGKKLIFEVRAVDVAGPIAHGTHERVIVDKEPFEQAALARRSADPATRGS